MKQQAASLFCVLALSLTACGGGGGSSSIPSTSTSTTSTATPTPSSSTTPSSSSDTPYTCPSANTSSGTLNCTDLPLGDQKFSTTTPKVGYIYSCRTLSGSPAVSSAPWLNTSAGTWNALEKIAVQGSVSWNGTFSASVNSGGTTRTIVSDGEPISPITTGVFPIQVTDPAHQYDGNPNSIGVQSFDFTVPANPTAAASPGCLSGGPIGITVTGVAIFDAFDAAGYDGVAREEQDTCHGHPDQSEMYHYHGWLQACVPDSGSATQNSSLLGYAADGYGIYGPWYNGKILTSADLDECHGTTSDVMWNGQLVNMYHYVSTYDFPYTLGCYKGTPVTL